MGRNHRRIRVFLVGAISAISAILNAAAMGLFGYFGVKGILGELSDTSRYENRMVGTLLLTAAGIFALHVAVAFQPYTHRSRLLYAVASGVDVAIILWALWPCVAGPTGNTVSVAIVLTVATANLAVVGLRWGFSDAERDWYTEPRGEETDQ